MEGSRFLHGVSGCDRPVSAFLALDWLSGSLGNGG